MGKLWLLLLRRPMEEAGADDPLLAISTECGITIGRRNMLDTSFAFLKLPARLHVDLHWEPFIPAAQALIAEGKKILWEIDLGLETAPFPHLDQTALLSYS